MSHFSFSSPPLRPFHYLPGESLHAVRKRFVASHPEYAKTNALDTLRKREFSRLNNGSTYLDYTGAGLYPESLVKDHAELLLHQVFGNPHSSSPSSSLSTRHANEARSAILAFFDADPSEYSVVFTSNSSNALRLVGESYPFRSGTSRLVLPVDAHNSVNGLREFARAAGAITSYVPMGADAAQMLASLSPHDLGLFALTGQSNVSGNKADLNLLRIAKRLSYDTLLDAAALAPTTAISLRDLQGTVDAMAISLYKMIGYPTGVGALVVRRDFLSILRKRWFSGGSVRIVQAPGQGRLLLEGHERWEDGTINFLSFPVVKPALDLLRTHLPILSLRLSFLMHFTLSSLESLRHQNGLPVVIIHSPSTITPYSPKTNGAVIALSILTSFGARVPPHDVEKAASQANIHIRAGCMCNPGAASSLLGLDDTLAGFRLGDPDNKIGAPTAAEAYAANEGMERLIEDEGVVRVSFGLASSLEDAYKFVTFVEGFKDVQHFQRRLAGSIGKEEKLQPSISRSKRRSSLLSELFHAVIQLRRPLCSTIL